MPRVNVLPSELINQIAAGEVVERPASVVKELLENSIDAGATAVDLILENGGRKLIEIRDNGCGMSEEDAVLSLERHATSKIRAFDDLTRVRTLGFRGEALPSIASVSRFTMTTRDQSSEHATEIELDPMTARRRVHPAARDRGTTIVVRELFENVPARRKFLKSADAEFRAIVTVVSSYALPHHRHAFRIDHNGRTVLDLPPASSARERMIQIIGSDSDPHLVDVAGTVGDITATGFVTRGLRYGSRRNQFFFVNGRLVKDRVLTHAANRAAEAFDFEGYPAIALFLDVPSEAVDVNVHPGKTEVRFRDSGSVHVAVEHSIKRALGGAEEGRTLLPGTQAVADAPLLPGAPLFGYRTYDDPARPAEHAGFTPLFQRDAVVQPPRESLQREPVQSGWAATTIAPDPDPASEPLVDLGALQGRVIGQYRLSYILLDTPGGLRLVDQHAAHERVLYDRYMERVTSAQEQGATQHLLTPILYESGAAETAALESHIGELRQLGFEMERFSGNSFAITAVPPELVRTDTQTFLKKLIDASLEEGKSHMATVRDKVCASLACQAAIKVHRPLSGEEMARLVAELLGTSNPFACPHGRPILVDIRHLDIEKHFHRK